MYAAMGRYVRWIDRVNYRIGRIVMYGVFVMIAVLMWSSISKTFFLPSLWTLEIAAESETKSRVVEIFKQYNADMQKAGRPYRFS
jgi:hypothetical protein